MLEKLDRIINPLTKIDLNNPLVLRFRDAAKKLIKGSAAEDARPQTARLPLNPPETDPALTEEMWFEKRKRVEIACDLRGVTEQGQMINSLLIKAVLLDHKVLEEYSKRDREAIIELYEDKQFGDLSPDNRETVILKLTGPKPTLPYTTPLKKPKNKER